MNLSFFKDPEQTIVKHTRIQDSGGRWRIEFEPSKSGIYQLQTNDPTLELAPMIMTSMEILPAHSNRTIEGERIIHPDVENYIIIYSPSDSTKVKLKRSFNANRISDLNEISTFH